MCKEVAILAYLRGEIPKFYLKHLYKKEFKNWKYYLGTRYGNLIRLSKVLHKPENVSIISNKLLFAFHLERHGLETPKMVAYNLGSRFFYKEKCHEIGTKADLLKFFENTFSDRKVDALFVRPYSLYGGDGIFKLRATDFADTLDAHFEHFMKGGFIITECIVQHPQIAKIHNSSVNSIRFLTYIDDTKEVQIVSAFMRFGTGSRIIDNACAGGFFIGIDMPSGRLKEKGYRLALYSGKEVFEHPDSKFKLEGFEIPYFKEACDLVKKAVQHIPDRLIGWDVAISTNGPVIIEANEGPGLHISDMAYDGLLRNEHIQEMMRNVLSES